MTVAHYEPKRTDPSAFDPWLDRRVLDALPHRTNWLVAWLLGLDVLLLVYVAHLLRGV